MQYFKSTLLRWKWIKMQVWSCLSHLRKRQWFLVALIEDHKPYNVPTSVLCGSFQPHYLFPLTLGALVTCFQPLPAAFLWYRAPMVSEQTSSFHTTDTAVMTKLPFGHFSTCSSLRILLSYNCTVLHTVYILESAMSAPNYPTCFLSFAWKDLSPSTSKASIFQLIPPQI